MIEANEDRNDKCLIDIDIFLHFDTPYLSAYAIRFNNEVSIMNKKKSIENKFL